MSLQHGQISRGIPSALSTQRAGGMVPETDRWTAWALALRDRHTRTALPSSPASMTLLPTWSAPVSAPHWTRVAISLTPRVDLAITPVVRQIAPSLVRYQGPEATVAAGRLEPMPRQIIVGSLDPHETTGSPRALARDGGGAAVTQTTGIAPMARVLARREAALLAPGSLTSSQGFTAQGEAMVRRIVEERRRIEERVRRLIVEEQPHRPSWLAAPGSRPQTVGETATWFALGAGHTAATPWVSGAASIDIDHLTEQVVRQIDHRVTALRERLGYPA